MRSSRPSGAPIRSCGFVTRYGTAISRDRRRVADIFRSNSRRPSSVFFLFARSFVVELRAGALALAVVGIGLSVACADRLPDFFAGLRNHLTLALRVGDL